MTKSRKYTIDGAEVQAIKSGPGHVIRYVYDDKFAEILGKPQYTEEYLFDSPPTKKYKENIAELREEILRLSSECASLTLKKAQAKKEYQETLSLLEHKDGLTELLDVLSLDFNYLFVQETWSAGILSLEDLEQKHGWRTYLRVLSLFGRPKEEEAGVRWEFQWHLNQYTDYSGNWHKVVPCKTYEEAKKLLTDFVDDKVSSGDITTATALRLITSYGLSLKEKTKRLLKEEIIRKSKSSKRKLKQHIEKEEKNIKEAEEKNLEALFTEGEME